jgi:alpha-maltose-1-phosphate synthase
MKILLIQLIGRGGAQLYTSQLASALSKTDEVVVILGDYLFERSHYDDTSASRFYFVKTSPSYFFMFFKLMNPMTYLNLNRIIQKEKPEVIHVVFEDLILSFLLLFLRNRYRIVITEHDPQLHDGEPLLIRTSFYLSRILSRNLSDAIIVHGQNLKIYLKGKKIPEKKIFVIPHGDFSYYKKYSTAKKEEKNTILFFGLIRDYKGLQFLMNSEPLIAASVPDIKIIIAGEGDFSKYYALIKNPVHFEIHNRYIHDSEVSEFFSRSALIVLPYTNASQSGIIPIAYAFQKPVVVTNVGSITEVVEQGKTGLIVPPKDSVALANAIITLLLNDTLRREMGSNAYRKMQDELSWEQIAQETMKIYKQTVPVKSYHA